MEQVWRREKGRPMLTVSNHQSVLDDPGLWCVLLPWWRMRPEQFRWSICTEDVFFAVPFLSPVYGAGNVMPLDRSGSLEQPLFKRFFEKLTGGSWCHIFAEGRVWQNWRFEDGEPRLGPFKFGIGKLIAHCPEGKEPLIVPLFHQGMDKVIPEKVLSKEKNKKASKPLSLFPKVGNQITMYVGEPFDFKDKIKAFREKHPGTLDSWQSSAEAIELYMEITNEVRKKVLVLELEAREAEAAKR